MVILTEADQIGILVVYGVFTGLLCFFVIRFRYFEIRAAPEYLPM